MADSKGIWIDTKTDKVVHAEPEEGVQICAPGQEVTPDVQATLDAHTAAKDEADDKTVKSVAKK